MNYKEIFEEVIDIEIESLHQLKQQIDNSIEKIIDVIFLSKGKVVVAGVGKSGLIGKKISATLSSTGTSSIFLHPTEALHGDLGIVKQEDVLLCISYSGETDELLKILPSLKSMSVKIIAITGNSNSTLANNSDYVINVKVDKEACPLELAPTSSTTVTLVIGDALSVALMKKRNFNKTDFAIFHPGGSLGRKLLCKVEDEMFKEDLPCNFMNDSIRNVIINITQGLLGLTIVVDEEQNILGIITDGDLRRALFKNDINFFDLTAQDIMKSNPTKVEKSILINDAELIMIEKNINSLIVHEQNKLIGVLTLKKNK